MSDIWTEDFDFADDIDDFGDNWDDLDAESYDGDFDADADEASAATRRRRARARRQLALARRRRRAALGRQRGAAGPGSRALAQRAPQAAIQHLDLENKVQNDSIERAFAIRDRRSRRAEAATVASVVASQVQASFGATNSILKSPYGRAALAAAPLALLSPAKRGRGLEGAIRDPRLIGAALVAGLAYFAQREQAEDEVDDIAVIAPSSVPQSALSLEVSANVLDGRKRRIAGRTDVKWETVDKTIAEFKNSDSGKLTLKAAGETSIKVTSGGVTRFFPIKVT